MADLQSASPMPQGERLSSFKAARPEPLAHGLAQETQIDPDLAQIVDAWPALPEPIRRAILVLAESIQ